MNDRLRGCADRVQDGIKSNGCAWNVLEQEDMRKEEGHMESERNIEHRTNKGPHRT
jgi:hypothetical protein